MRVQVGHNSWVRIFIFFPRSRLTHFVFRKDYPLYGEGPDADFTEARRLLYHNIQHLCFLQGYLVHDETKALLHLQSLLKTHELGKEGPYPFTSMTGSGFIASSAAKLFQ